MIAPLKKSVVDLTPSEALTRAETEATWLLQFGDLVPRRVESARRNYLGRLLRKAFKDCGDAPFEETYPEGFTSLEFDPVSDCVRV
jgi:hypothetical protein